MTFTLTLGDIAIEEVRQQILAPLVAYNASQAGPSNGRPLVITVTNSEKEVIGGLWGTTGYEWLFTQLLVVPPSARGAGLGTHLMQRAENEAIARGCKGAWLDTFEFQARGFYERLGYECFGEIPNYPTGYSRFFMRKTLSANVAI